MNDEQKMVRFLADAGTFSLWPAERRDELVGLLQSMSHQEIGRATVAHFVAQLRAAASTSSVTLEALRGARDEVRSELERLLIDLRDSGVRIPARLQARLDAVRNERDGDGTK